jgi:hypothetical protein
MSQGETVTISKADVAAIPAALVQDSAVAALNAEIAAISAQRKKLKQGMRALIGERDKRLAQAATAAKLAAMSPAEREALKAALKG